MIMKKTVPVDFYPPEEVNPGGAEERHIFQDQMGKCSAGPKS